MPNYRRAFHPGGTFFFTVVTERRRPFLCEPAARRILHQAIETCRNSRPFELTAIVVLPDHLHTLWRLPDGDSDFSTRWSHIKSTFTRDWLAEVGQEAAVSDSRHRNRRRGVWQRRFWEHQIVDQADFDRHLDYIHYNPVTHRAATCPHAWEWSSFHRWVRNGHYPPEWQCGCNAHPNRPLDMKWAESYALE